MVKNMTAKYVNQSCPVCGGRVQEYRTAHPDYMNFRCSVCPLDGVIDKKREKIYYNQKEKETKNVGKKRRS